MRTALVCLLLAVIPACNSLPAPPTPGDTPESKLASLTWMAGTWLGRSDKSTWEAHYTSPAGGLMVSMTKRYDSTGGIDFFEFETFHVEKGQLVLRPYLAGRNSVAFPLKSLDHDARRAVFENPDNEPSTLDYWRVDNDTLVIAVTSPIKGEVKEGEPKASGFRIVLKRPR